MWRVVCMIVWFLRLCSSSGFVVCVVNVMSGIGSVSYTMNQFYVHLVVFLDALCLLIAVGVVDLMFLIQSWLGLKLM